MGSIKKKPLSLRQKVFIVKSYYANGGDLQLGRAIFDSEFNVRFKDNISDVFQKLVEVFEKTGSVKQAFFYEYYEAMPTDETDPNITVPVVKQSEIGIEFSSNISDENEEEKEIDCKGDVESSLPTPKSPLPTAPKRKPTTKDGKCACHHCGKVFKKNVYYQHVLTHNELNQYECKVCKKSFKTRRYLNDHQIIHIPLEDRQNRFVCEICGKNSTSKTNHNKHLKVHSGVRAYVCEWCGKEFIRSHGLRVHVRIHTGERPYTCKFCDKSFGTHLSYQIHTRIHTGERPYECKYCDKSFIGASARNVHLRKHKVNEYSHYCTICEKRFKYASILETHLEQAHENADCV